MAGAKKGGRAREYISLAVVAAVIVAGLLLARHYDAPLRRFIEGHPAPGVFLYILLNILDAMVAPGATLAVASISLETSPAGIAGRPSTANPKSSKSA